MMISCESCQSKYSVADEKIRGKTVKIRCRECQTMMVAKGPDVVRSEAPEAQAPVAQVAAVAAPESVAPAAIVKRGGARPKRDFFAEASQEVASVPPQNMFSNATAQRNENSCLFTLAGLTRKPVMDLPKEVEATTTVNSGLIDLNGMRTNARRSHLSVVEPLFGSLPPLGMTIEVAPEPPPRKRRGIFIGIGAALAVLAIVGIGIGASRGGDKASAAAAAPIAADPLPPAAPTPEPVVAKEPAPSDTASTAPGSTNKVATSSGAKGKANGKRGAGPASKAGAAPKQTKTTTTTKPAAKPHGSDACGCNGELMCLMRCSK